MINLARNAFLILLGLGFLIPVSEAGQMKEIRFSQMPGGAAQVEFFHSGEANFSVKVLKEFDQIIVMVKGISLTPNLTKIIDASLSQTPIVQITPYNTGRGATDTKVVIQLKESVKVNSRKDGKKFILEVAPILARGGEGRLPRGLAASLNSDKISVRASAMSRYEQSVATALELIKTLDTPEEERVYRGKKISFSSAKASVFDVFKLVSEASGLNLVASTEDILQKTVSLSLRDVPWDQLIELVLQQHGLKAQAIGNVINIMTLEAYTKMQDEKLNALVAAEGLEPTIMGIIPVSFAKAEELSRMIGTLLKLEKDSDKNSNAKKQTQTVTEVVNGRTITRVIEGTDAQRELQEVFVRGKIEVDTRSNSLVVTNTKEAIERVRALVKELDVALPQILVDAKVLIASEQWSRDLGINWAGRATTTGEGRAGIGLSFNGGTVTTSTATSDGPAFSISSGPGSVASGFQVGSGQHGNLSLQISLGESTGLNKVVASPRIIVNNKKTASLFDGTTIGLLTSGVNAAGDLKTVEAGLALSVTPQVTNSGSVLMNLNIEKGAPVPNSRGDVTRKNLNTEVLVESGATMVLGGVYSYDSVSSENGIPLLRNLPFIGQLFRTNNDAWGKSELMVFVTPKILEPGPTGAPATLQ